MKKYLIAPIRNNLLLILIFGFWVGGCSKSISATRDEDFKAILPVQDLNRSLKLSKVSVEGYGESNSFVIMVENQAESLIAFPKDYGIGLYRYINDEWTKIPNRMIYLTEENIIVRPKGSPLGFDQSHISFYPDLSELQQPVSIRLAVKGNIQNEDGSLGEEVGAYIDFTWEP